jgi:hypothetical protein
MNWEKLDLGTRFIPPPMNKTIPFKVTPAERRKLQVIVQHQYGKTETLQTIMRIYAVLKWHYTRMHRPAFAWKVIEDFAPSLGKKGARLEI